MHAAVHFLSRPLNQSKNKDNWNLDTRVQVSKNMQEQLLQLKRLNC